MTALCAHPGCMARLSGDNVSGMCKAHVHAPGCRCAGCKGPRKARPRSLRNIQSWRGPSRAVTGAEGQLPGFGPSLTPSPKGST